MKQKVKWCEALVESFLRHPVRKQSGFTLTTYTGAKTQVITHLEMPWQQIISLSSNTAALKPI